MSTRPGVGTLTTAGKDKIADRCDVTGGLALAEHTDCG
jgi:hypothetical protein